MSCLVLCNKLNPEFSAAPAEFKNVSQQVKLLLAGASLLFKGSCRVFVNGDKLLADKMGG